MNKSLSLSLAFLCGLVSAAAFAQTSSGPNTKINITLTSGDVVIFPYEILWRDSGPAGEVDGGVFFVGDGTPCCGRPFNPLTTSGPGFHPYRYDAHDDDLTVAFVPNGHNGFVGVSGPGDQGGTADLLLTIDTFAPITHAGAYAGTFGLEGTIHADNTVLEFDGVAHGTFNIGDCPSKPHCFYLSYSELSLGNASVPEPATLWLLLPGVVGLVVLGRRRRWTMTSP